MEATTDAWMRGAVVRHTTAPDNRMMSLPCSLQYACFIDFHATEDIAVRRDKMSHVKKLDLITGYKIFLYYHCQLRIAQYVGVA